MHELFSSHAISSFCDRVLVLARLRTEITAKGLSGFLGFGPNLYVLLIAVQVHGPGVRDGFAGGMISNSCALWHILSGSPWDGDADQGFWCSSMQLISFTDSASGFEKMVVVALMRASYCSGWAGYRAQKVGCRESDREGYVLQVR